MSVHVPTPFTADGIVPSILLHLCQILLTVSFKYNKNGQVSSDFAPHIDLGLGLGRVWVSFSRVRFWDSDNICMVWCKNQRDQNCPHCTAWSKKAGLVHIFAFIFETP